MHLRGLTRWRSGIRVHRISLSARRSTPGFDCGMRPPGPWPERRGFAMRLPWYAKGSALLTSLLLTAGCADRTVKPELALQNQPVRATGGEVYNTPVGTRLSSGALYQVSVIPGRWNGDIVVY